MVSVKSKVVQKTGQDKVNELVKKCSDIDSQIIKLQEKRSEIRKQILELEIAPFKIGDYAYAELHSGRSVKRQKCLLENEDGVLYLRPVTKDGVLSGRHFSCIPVKKSYSEILEKVEE